MIKSKTLSNTQHLTQEAQKVASAVARRRRPATGWRLHWGQPPLVGLSFDCLIVSFCWSFNLTRIFTALACILIL
jgi:hypothetical protein